MKVDLVREYRFEAAHRLPNVPPGHQCQRLHGHSCKFELTITGPVDAHTGWFIDYGVLDDIVEPLRKQLDHYYLNEIPGLENPTSELLARWLWDRIRAQLPVLSAVTVFETCDSRCVYRGEE